MTDTYDTENLQVNRMNVEDRMQRSALELNHKRTPVTLEWNNIAYTLKIKDPTSKKCCGSKMDKTILHGISGVAKPGELVAIMGPSGSGKTTLLNVLAGRIATTKGAKLEGEIKVNGVNRSDIGSKYARISSFVQQDDVLFSLQTVRETLLTSARFRLPREVSMAEKNRRVDAIIAELGLSKAEHTHIGDAKIRGVSGGERKRTNIGVELIQDPSLLFLDEPTSGLDSFQALNVIETLKLLCKSGTTVILSIHQPRSSIFALFDHLIILAEGHTIYDGPAGQESVDYFTKIGFPCPDLYNPADFFLDLVSLDNRSSEEEQKSNQRIELLVKSQKKFKQQNKDESKNNNDDESTSESLDKFEDVKSVRSGCCEQIFVLSKRNYRQLSRNKFELFIRTFMTLFFALFISALYSETDYGQKSIQDRSGILFFIAINQSFGPLFNTVNTFVQEKAIVMRERQAKSYYLSSYYTTRVLTALPVDIVAPILFTCIVYFIVGLNDAPEAFAVFLLIIIAVSTSAIGLGFCIGSIAPTVEAASAMAPVFMVLMILFGGFYINSDNVPVWLGWLQNVSTIQWSYAAFAINEFKGAEFTCDDVDFVDAGDSTTSSNGGQGCITDGEQVIELLSFDEYTKFECIGYLFVLTATFHTIAYLILRFNREKYLDVTPPQNIYLNQEQIEHDDVQISLKNKTQKIGNETMVQMENQIQNNEKENNEASDKDNE